MYICNCNGITTSEVKQAGAMGARNAKDVFQQLDMTQCCGKCTPDMKQCLADASQEINGQPASSIPNLDIAAVSA